MTETTPHETPEAEPLTLDWALTYARQYWKHGGEPESQAALTILARHVDPARDADLRAEGARQFAEWVATHRAYNGSEHTRGQALYNECLNAVLTDWAGAWGRAALTEAGDES